MHNDLHLVDLVRHFQESTDDIRLFEAEVKKKEAVLEGVG